MLFNEDDIKRAVDATRDVCADLIRQETSASSVAMALYSRTLDDFYKLVLEHARAKTKPKVTP
jgi:hypothetical protein